MKESIGYTVILNIAITFIIIVFAFLSIIMIYYKSNKCSLIVTNALEKYEGDNSLSIAEINSKFTSFGYNFNKINCGNTVTDKNAKDDTCTLTENLDGQGSKGYCIYLCYYKNDSNYYYYKVRTNMLVNIPIVNNIMNYPIYTVTSYIYKFS